MSSNDKIDNAIQSNSSTIYNAANSMDNIKNISNTSNHLHSSHNSTISNESDLSLLSVSLEKELELNAKAIDIDELPAFEIRLISPLGRTPSPIDSEHMETPTRPPPISAEERLLVSSCRNNPDFVALHDINAQISPPSDNESEVESYLNRTSSLETIFEGVFLNTPPRQQLSLQNKCKSRSRTNLLERVALNRLNADKENQAPLTNSETPPSKTPDTDFSCVKDSSSVYEKYNFT